MEEIIGFSNYTWNNNQLGFTVTQDVALNLKGMPPRVVAAGTFVSLAKNGIPVNTTIDSIKGISYIFDVEWKLPGNLWRIRRRSTQQQFTWFRRKTLTTGFTYYLGQNYPNPFYQNTRINYSIAHSGNVELILYDLQGGSSEAGQSDWIQVIIFTI